MDNDSLYDAIHSNNVRAWLDYYGIGHYWTNCIRNISSSLLEYIIVADGDIAEYGNAFIRIPHGSKFEVQCDFLSKMMAAIKDANANKLKYASLGIEEPVMQEMH